MLPTAVAPPLSPQPHPALPDDVRQHVDLGGVQAPGGFSIMAFDVPPDRPHDSGTDALYVSVRGDDPAELTRYWQGLADGGTVRAALGPAGYAPLYGMVTDRFGITWVLDLAVPHTG